MQRNVFLCVFFVCFQERLRAQSSRGKCTFSNARIFVYKSLCRWSWEIFNMVMYVVHFHPVQQKYKTHICSRATLFQFFVIFLTFIPPLIIAYVTNGKQFLIASVSQTWSFFVDLCVLFVNFAHLPRKNHRFLAQGEHLQRATRRSIQTRNPSSSSRKYPWFIPRLQHLPKFQPPSATKA